MAIKRALIARGVGQEDLALIEFGSEFAAELQLRYPSPYAVDERNSGADSTPL